MPGIGRNLLSIKSATREGVVSIFDLDNPRLVLSGITAPLCEKDDDRYSLVFDLSAGSHEGKKLAMSEMANAQLWLRRLAYLNKRSFELMQRRNCNGVVCDGSINPCDVCAVRKRHQLAQPKKAKHADITAPFQFVYGDLMDTFKPTVHRGYEYGSKITDQNQMGRSILALHQGPSPCVATAIRHFNRHSIRQPNRHLANR